MRRAAEPDLLGLLDLVALATVCDVVPLKGVNRALVAKGLKVLRHRHNAGLRALADVARIDAAPTCYTLGYHPRPAHQCRRQGGGIRPRRQAARLRR